MTALQRHLNPAKLLPCKKGHCKRATYPKHVLVPVLFCREKRVDLREVEPQEMFLLELCSWSGCSNVKQGPEAAQAPSSVTAMLQFSSCGYHLGGMGLRHACVKDCHLSF